METWQTMEKPSLWELGTSPRELKTCERDEDGKVEDGTLLRIVHALRHEENETRGKVSDARDQPRLPFSSVSRDLFPLGRDPQLVLPRQGYSRRVETLRRHLVDDALSVLNWPSGKRGPLSFAHDQMQDACVARVDNLACAMLGDISIVGVPTSASTLLTVVRDLPH